MGLAWQGNASFDTAVRALLGVTDQRRKLTSSMPGHCGSTYTLESWDQVSVSCAGRSADSQDLPKLLRAG